MQLYKIDTGNFKLDGGAMFGVVPKKLWNNLYPADENNLCTLSLRCLLVKTDSRLILIDTGLGNKQSEKFFGYYNLGNQVPLEKAIQQQGFSVNQVTDVLLTHLHFDHCGGAVIKENEESFKPLFPNATYWVSSAQWKWAMNPNYREKASYLKENIMPLYESGRMKFIEQEGAFAEWVEVRIFNGHTAGLLVPILTINNKKLIYIGDFIPTTAHIPVSWVCGFDTQPLLSLIEKTEFLKEAAENDYTFFFEHDFNNECCTLTPGEKGIVVKETFELDEFLSLSDK